MSTDFVTDAVPPLIPGDTTFSTGVFTKDVQIRGTTWITCTNDSTSITTGALIVSGGVGVAKNLFVGGTTSVNTVSITSTVDSVSTTTGALLVAGGVGIGKSVTIGGTMTSASVAATNLVVTNSTVTGLVATSAVITGATATGLSVVGAINFSAAKSGVTTLVSGAKTVNTGVTLATGDRVFVSRNGDANVTCGALGARVIAIGGAGVASFVITSSIATDVSVVNWVVFNSASF